MLKFKARIPTYISREWAIAKICTNSRRFRRRRSWAFWAQDFYSWLNQRFPSCIL